MNTQLNNPQPKAARFFVHLGAWNILGKPRIDFELYRPVLDKEVVNQVAEASGFNPNHPNFDDLVHQIEHSFTLDEINQFIGCLPPQTVLEISIKKAAYRVRDPIVPKKGEMLVKIYSIEETFDFSTLEGYSLPFVIKGHYDPHNCR